MAGMRQEVRDGSLSRRERQRRLKETIASDPFLTDEDLAGRFGVSVQTIRLDRMALAIPELRERTRAVARDAHARVRAVGIREIVGEIVDLELGERGLSILETTADMAFERTGLVRSQYIFAQADSLALAIIDSPRAVVKLTNAKFKQSVPIGARLVAKAEILRSKDNEFVVLVQTRVEDMIVFRGKFVVVGLDDVTDRPEA